MINKHKSIKFHFYEVNTQVYVHLFQRNTSAAYEQLSRCLDNVKEWMSTKKLKMSLDKTESILFSSKKQREKLTAWFPIDILGSSFCPAESIKNFGVWFNSNFTLSKHVQSVCKSCVIQLYDFRRMKQFLAYNASILVANALVSSQLDYRNSFFRSLSKFNLRKLQCIQNSAARIISNLTRYAYKTCC